MILFYNYSKIISLFFSEVIMIITRFAPSPTGYLHIGGARTALYSWLLSQKNSGNFILRIEDTDLDRSTQESVDAIIESMQWLGLHHDNPEIFYQTKRVDIYQNIIQKLIDEGKAYKCYCTQEELELVRKQQKENNQKTKYNGKCRHSSDSYNDKPFVIRFKNPTSGSVVWNDLIKGQIEISNSELDDLIIQRSNGMFTYNFTAAIDDWLMNVSHVVRGDDHVSNTPRQINILQALGANIPQYAHLPMILGSDGERLSKRHGAVGVMEFRKLGFLPEAIINYLARLGWSHGDQEIFSLNELKTLFTLEKCNSSPASFDLNKLLWFNQVYIKSMEPSDIAKHLKWHLEQQKLDVGNGVDIEKVIKLQSNRVKTLKEMVEVSRYFYEDFDKYDTESAQRHLNSQSKHVLEYSFDKFKSVDLENWNSDYISSLLKNIAKELNIKFPDIAMPLRVSITGTINSPSIDQTISLISKEVVLNRILKAIRYIA